MVAHVERSTSLPYPPSEVASWFGRPGSVVRLTPPFLGSATERDDAGTDVARIGVHPPTTLATGLSALAVSLPLPAGVPTWLRRGEMPVEVRREAIGDNLFRSTADVDRLGRIVAEHRFEADGVTGTVLRESVDVELSGDDRVEAIAEAPMRRWVERVLEYRSSQIRDDLAFHAAHRTDRPLTVAVAGASGLLGTQLCALLESGGHQVLRLVRRDAGGPGEISWDPARQRVDTERLREADVVVNLAGRTIGGRFTESTKQEILRSRVDGTSLLARTLAGLAADGRPRALVASSGIGYYGTDPHAERGDAPLTEDSPSGNGFLAEVCRQWEAATAPAAEAGVRTVSVRTGLVQTPAGGPLPRLLPLFAVGIGGPLDKDQWMSWISVDDAVSVLAAAALDPRLSGPVNAVGPAPVRGGEYARTLGKVLRRPSAIPVPPFGPRLVVGKEGAEELAYASQRVAPAKLQAAGFDFRHPTLESALRHVLP